MKLSIETRLDYQFEHPTDILLQLEAAATPQQAVLASDIAFSPTDHSVRVAAQDLIGERIWLRAEGQLTVAYSALVEVKRGLDDCLNLPQVPLHELPGEAVQYLLPSRYCPSDQFQTIADADFGDLTGGARVIAARDWVQSHFTYTPGASTAETTALDSFVRRQGVCRDYAHVLITLMRASAIPARIASVYALGVEPQDFHAVAEVFIGGAWHLVDATGMARVSDMAIIGVGRDAADVAFLTAYGAAVMNGQSVSVVAADGTARSS